MPGKVECTIQTCPPVLQKGFCELFAEIEGSKELTVITISQQTQHDMTVWSEEVEVERENLMAAVSLLFIICQVMKNCM